MKKSNVKLEEAIEYVNTMYHNKMNNDEEFTDLELASVRLLRERTLNKYEIERLNNIIKELENYVRARADDNYTCSVCSVMTDDLLNIIKGSDKE